MEFKGEYAECKVFADFVEETAIQQIYRFLNHPAFENLKIRVMPDCLPGETEVLTSDGFVPISSLTLESHIASYDPSDQSVLFENPQSLIARGLDIGEKLVHFETPSGCFVTTKRHRTAFKPNMGQEAQTFLQSPCLMKDFYWHGKGVRNAKGVDLTNEEIQFLAWVIGDGSLLINHNKNSDGIRIRFGLKKTRKIDRIKDLMSKLSLSYHEYIARDETNITINTEDSLKYVGIVGRTKTYPLSWLQDMTREQAECLIDEMISVDGDYEAAQRRRGYRLNTAKSTEADFLTALLVLNKGLTSTKLRTTDGFNGLSEVYLINMVSESTLNFSRSGYHSRTIKVKEIEYSDPVWCLTCSTGFFIARYRGMCFVTGNCHAGAGAVIGFTSTLGSKVIPNVIGVDIGCGISSYNMGKIDLNFEEVDKIIKDNIPSGFSVREKPLQKYLLDKFDHKNLLEKVEEICTRTNQDYNRVERSLGTLGGGNHFIEIGEDQNGDKWLTVHTGSRNFGLKVALFHQNIAKKSNPNGDLSYLEGAEADAYYHDMKVAQEYAEANRVVIATDILRNLRARHTEMVESVHNYINFNQGIVRKGAISAAAGERVVIPWNMRDGLVLGVGKGNEDWNSSAPHGAGRVMGRVVAKKTLDIEDFKKSMEGIWTSCVSQETLDESPMVYKNHEEIETHLHETVEVTHRVKPLYNFKAGCE
jgi:RNA-splicing ligase RtcB